MSVYRLGVGDYFYFGSTGAGLNERLRTHKTDYDRLNTRLYETIRGAGGWDAVTAEVIKECDDYESEEDRLIREHWGNPMLLNARRVTITNEERKDLNAAYYKTLKETKPDKVREYGRSAYLNRRDSEEYKQQVAAYRDAHRSEIAAAARARFAALTREQRDEVNRKKRERRAARLLNQ